MRNLACSPWVVDDKDDRNMTTRAQRTISDAELDYSTEAHGRIPMLVDREELTRQARAKGVGPSTLARMWIKGRLGAESGRS
jgi:hypothetical protein